MVHQTDSGGDLCQTTAEPREPCVTVSVLQLFDLLSVFIST